MLATFASGGYVGILLAPRDLASHIAVASSLVIILVCAFGGLFVGGLLSAFLD